MKKQIGDPAARSTETCRDPKFVMRLVRRKEERCKEEEERMLQQAEERQARILRCCVSVQLGPG
jgi:hypothetical protein